jgi:phage terminase large subunit GpA-like protein
MKWENVTWTGRKSVDIATAEEDVNQEHDPDSAAYVCAINGCLWSDGERVAAIRNAERLGHGWKAAKPFKGHASFHAPEMLSTFRRLRDIVKSYLDKIAIGDIQSFANVSLAETYEETGERADPTGLMARAEEYAAQVPSGGLYLTAGIDMQTDRLEAEVVAWGEGEESWSIEYRVFEGDPLAGDVWDDLDDFLAGGYVHESGKILPIQAACLDTGGNSGYTQRAYEYLRGKTGRRLFGIKGIAPSFGKPIVEKSLRKQSGKNSRKVDLFLVATDEAKLMVMRRLALSTPGPGYCHFPDDRSADWYKQLTAEKMVTRYVKGQPVREWHKQDKARNEALDTRVYALAALKIMQPSMRRMAERLGVTHRPLPDDENRPEVTARPVQEDSDIGIPITEINPEATPAQVPQTARVVPPKRTLKQRVKGRNYATSW